MSDPRATSERAVTLVLLSVALVVVASLVLRSLREPHSPTYRGIAQDHDQAPEYIRHWTRGLDLGFPVNGPRDAPVTVLVLHDYQCPSCRLFNEILDSAVSYFGGAVRVVLIDHPLDYHPLSMPAAHAATCAHDLGVLPAWVEAVYRSQDSLGLKSWSVIAAEIGVTDAAGFGRCVDSAPALHRIRASLEFGEAIGVDGTPAVVVDGWRLGRPPSTALLMAAIQSALAGEAAPEPREAPVWLHLDSLPLARRLGIREELRVGGTRDAGVLLDAVGQAVVGEDMSVVVSQPSYSEVLVFDSVGRLTATLGGRGEGPGEFQDLFSLGILGDTLYVADRVTARVTFFRHGRLLDSRRWLADVSPQPVEGGLLLFPNVPAVIVADDRALVRPNWTIRATDIRGEVSLVLPIWLVDGESRVLGTPVREQLSGVGMSVTHEGTGFQAAAPLQREPFTGLSAGGIGAVTVSYPSGRLTLTAIEPAGDTVFARELRYLHQPPSDSGIRLALTRMRIVPAPPDGEEAAIRSAFEEELRRDGLLPDHLPPITGLFVGQDGSIWLRREETGEDVIDYAVLWGDGTPRGTVAVPAGQRVVAARNEVMVAVAEDELGVPALVRYRVQR